MSRLRLGVIGSGNAAATIHLPAFARLADRVELVALSGSDPARRDALAERHGIERRHDSAEALVASGGLDAVVVCLANRFHAPVALAALGEGLHVLCEKPPAMNRAEAAAMAAKARETGTTLAYGFQKRFASEATALRTMAASGRFGRVYAGKAIAVRRRGVPGWGSFGDRSVQGGGPLMDIGVHMLDLALHLRGYPEPVEAFAAAYAEIATRPGPGTLGAWDHAAYGVEDSLFGMLRFADGSTLGVETAFALNVGERGRMDVELYGSLAGASAFPLEIHGEADGQLADTKLPFLPAVDEYFEQAKAFVAACSGEADAGAELLAGPGDGERLMLAVELLYRSAEEGRAVRPPEPGR